MAAILALKRALVPWSNPSAYATNLWLCLCEYALVNAALTRHRKPARAVLVKQVRASLVAAPAYALLPTAVEWLAARGATRLHSCTLTRHTKSKTRRTILSAGGLLSDRVAYSWVTTTASTGQE